MLQPKPARAPEPIATGLLAKRPLAHLLVYSLDRKLTGSFELVDDSRERAQIVVLDGKVARVSTSEPVIYLGHLIYESGLISGAQLSESLADVAATKRLHGAILLEKKMIDEDQLAEALRQQRLRKLHHVFALSPRTTFAFYPNIDLVGERPHDVAPIDPLPSVWRGISAHPYWDHVRATVAAVAGRPMRLVGEVDGLGLETSERAAAERLRRTPLTVSELASRGLEGRAADLLVYFLVITKLAEITEPAGAAPAADPPQPPPRESGALGAVLATGEYARKMSFTMRAVSPDAHPLRIPSPMPGRVTTSSSAISAVAPPARASSPAVVSPAGPARRDSAGRMKAVVVDPAAPRAPAKATTSRKDLLAAEHDLSQAEMHFVLGEREQAVGLVRKALAVVPELPAAMVFLAYLEAAGLAGGQEDYLRDLLKMLDTAIAKDETCRRGRYYRAELRKRLEDHEGAIRDLRCAVTSDPDDVDAQRELRAYEKKIHDGTIQIRSMSPFGGTPRVGLFDRLRGK